MESRIKKTNEYDVVISGAGPFGLGTAIEVAKAGQSVLIISNVSREDSTLRMQRLTARDKDLSYLGAMRPKHSALDDQKFLEAIEKKSNVAIKDIEQYLQRRLDELKEQGCRIDYKFDSELSQVDLFEGTANISDLKKEKEKEKEAAAQEIKFTFLVGAEGVKRHAYKLLQQTNQAPEIQEETFDYLPGLPTQHVSSYFILHRKDGQAFKLAQKNRSTYINVVEGRFGINLDLNSYYKSNKKQIKVQLVTSYPDEIARMEDRYARQKALDNYLKDRLDSLLHDMDMSPEDYTTKPTNPSKKHGSQKDKLKFNIFQTRRVGLNQTAVVVNGHWFITGAEGAYNSDYRIGEGIPKAFKAARDIKKIVTGKMQVDEYNQKRQEEAEKSKETLRRLSRSSPNDFFRLLTILASSSSNTPKTKKHNKADSKNLSSGSTKSRTIKIGKYLLEFREEAIFNNLILSENGDKLNSLLLSKSSRKFAKLIKENNIKLIIKKLEKYSLQGYSENATQMADRLKAEVFGLSTQTVTVGKYKLQLKSSDKYDKLTLLKNDEEIELATISDMSSELKKCFQENNISKIIEILKNRNSPSSLKIANKLQIQEQKILSLSPHTIFNVNAKDEDKKVARRELSQKIKRNKPLPPFQ